MKVDLDNDRIFGLQNRNEWLSLFAVLAAAQTIEYRLIELPVPAELAPGRAGLP